MAEHWKQYRSGPIIEARPYIVGEDLTGIVLEEDSTTLDANGQATGKVPVNGDYVARQLDAPTCQWIIGKDKLKNFYEKV